MNREPKAFLLASGMIVAAVVLQSTLLRWVAVRGVIPDLGLIVLAFAAVRRGPMTGQLSGFTGGIVEDLLSLSPLGFHAFVRTLLGFLYGLAAGNVFVDPILMPVVLTVIATLLKALVSALLVALFAISAPGIAVFAGPLWIEIAYNAILAPFLFALLGLFRTLRARDKDQP